MSKKVITTIKARKLSDTFNKNTKYFLAPWMISEIEERAKKGKRFCIFDNWTEGGKILLEDLGFKTEVRYTKKFLGKLESYLVVIW